MKFRALRQRPDFEDRLGFENAVFEASARVEGLVDCS